MTSYDDGYLKSNPIDPDKWPLPEAEMAKPHAKFRPEFVNTDTDMVHVVQRMMLVREFAGANFLFYGPSGTGKTEFGRYFAQQLGMPAMVVHTGDILFGRWGATERILGSIFKKAAEIKAVLIFDEADSFLYSRTQRELRNFEIQIVNEFLRLFEQHSQPVICTTNFIENLDAAIQRRFMFKVLFKPLEAAQVELAFKKYFEMPTPDYLVKLKGVTLGDFAVVHRKARVLGYLHDVKGLCDLFYHEALLRFELEQKRQAKKKAA